MLELDFQGPHARDFAKSASGLLAVSRCVEVQGCRSLQFQGLRSAVRSSCTRIDQEPAKRTDM